MGTSEQHLAEIEIIKPDAKRQWDQSKELRAEFNGDFDAYLAYSIAKSKGLVRVRGEARKP